MSSRHNSTKCTACLTVSVIFIQVDDDKVTYAAIRVTAGPQDNCNN